MLNKKMVMFSGILLLIAGIVLSGLLPETEFLHAPFQLLVLATVLLSVYMQVKDIIIIVMIAVIVVLVMSTFGIINQTHQILLETGAIILVLFTMGHYETGHKGESQKLTVISNYKQKEVENIQAETAVLNQENHEISEKIKEIRKIFGQ